MTVSSSFYTSPPGPNRKPTEYNEDTPLTSLGFNWTAAMTRGLKEGEIF